MTMRRRGKATVNGHSTISPPSGDDTIELQLTAEQVRDLSLAAEEAEAVALAEISSVAAPNRTAPAFAPPEPLFQVGPARRTRRWHPAGIAKMAAATVAYAAFAWWSASQLAARPQPAATAAAKPAVVIPPPALVASSPKPAVQVINPFDPKEVFEFPAGTSPAEGREQVAQVLLKRARERQSQWERNKPVVNLRTASLYRPPHN
jgi:hypothetical protein